MIGDVRSYLCEDACHFFVSAYGTVSAKIFLHIRSVIQQDANVSHSLGRCYLSSVACACVVTSEMVETLHLNISQSNNDYFWNA